MISKEYFVLSESVENEMRIDTDDHYTDDAISQDKFLDPNRLLKFEFDADDIKHPILYDSLIKGIYPLISGRIKEVLELFDYHSGIQFVPAILSFNDKIFENYFLLHVISYISCLDKKNSAFRVFKNLDVISSFDKLALLNDKIRKTPFKERLIFRLAEDPGVYLFHESIVEALMKINPTGIQLVPVENWNSYVDQ